jgi:hypothetical protein
VERLFHVDLLFALLILDRFHFFADAHVISHLSFAFILLVACVDLLQWQLVRFEWISLVQGSLVVGLDHGLGGVGDVLAFFLQDLVGERILFAQMSLV